MKLKPHNVPETLKGCAQWVNWKIISRGDKPTKVPFQPNGETASSTDPATWTSFTSALDASERFSGIGFVFDREDDFCGVDLDGCRDPNTGIVADWAREIIKKFGTYAEVSPSETGVKLFCLGRSPVGGKKVELPHNSIGGKKAAVEVYDQGRYFAVTGWRLAGCSHEPIDCQTQLDELASELFQVKHDAPKVDWSKFYHDDKVVERAIAYVQKMPPSVSGSGGHNSLFKAACRVVNGFALDDGQAMAVLRVFNQNCSPAWSERELEHKIKQARKQPGAVGYLRNVTVERWDAVRLPDIKEPGQPQEQESTVNVTTLADAAKKYIERLSAGKTKLITTGIPELDYAVGGGFEAGEMVILGGRPSHGKSVLALQFSHHWTAQGHKTLIVSEEMSYLALGKRALQYIADMPEEYWCHRAEELTAQLNSFTAERAECYIAEFCGSTARAVAEIERFHGEHGVSCVVVDYAQLLKSEGKGRYEQVTQTSIALKKTASKLGVLVLALCQISREVESRQKFIPQLSDLRDSGQLEQDADAVLFGVYPHRLDPSRGREEYQIFVAKNRNRAINCPMVELKFEAMRQRVSEPTKAKAWSHEADPFAYRGL